jgi:hypothetical protein
MLDSGVFAGIRDLCAKGSPGDFVERDACEQDRMTLARQEL